MAGSIESDQGKRAGAWFNEDFYSIKTYSGHGMLKADPKGAQIILPPDADDNALGDAVLEALSKSRVISLEECGAFFDLNQNKLDYENFVKKMMEQYGYKTKRAMFKKMLNCSISLVGDKITISPSVHEKLEGWSGDKDLADVVIPANSSAIEVGSALKLCFSRCV